MATYSAPVGSRTTRRRMAASKKRTKGCVKDPKTGRCKRRKKG